MLVCGTAGSLALRDAPASTAAVRKPKRMSPPGPCEEDQRDSRAGRGLRGLTAEQGLGRRAFVEGIGAAKMDPPAGHLLAEDMRLLTF